MQSSSGSNRRRSFNVATVTIAININVIWTITMIECYDSFLMR